SACETGLGGEGGGNGLVGFAHAFLARGARSVVLSRWKVDDTATALLMVRFYENLLGNRDGRKALGRAEALAEARTWLRGLSRKDAPGVARALTGGLPQGTDGRRGKVVPLLPVVKKPAPVPAGDR